MGSLEAHPPLPPKTEIQEILKGQNLKEET